MTSWRTLEKNFEMKPTPHRRGCDLWRPQYAQSAESRSNYCVIQTERRISPSRLAWASSVRTPSPSIINPNIEIKIGLVKRRGFTTTEPTAWRTDGGSTAMSKNYEPGETRVRKQEPLWAKLGTSSAPSRSGKPCSREPSHYAGYNSPELKWCWWGVVAWRWLNRIQQGREIGGSSFYPSSQQPPGKHKTSAITLQRNQPELAR